MRDTLLEPQAPYQLQKMQEWFGGIITQPLTSNQNIQAITPNGNPIANEAIKFIQKGPVLAPAQRIEIYNQQYWWRLFKTLQENFPLVTRLFSPSSFDCDVVTPYLRDYPPNHWSLSHLGDHLVDWLKKNYNGKDQKLISDATELDWTFNQCFIEIQHSPLDLQKLSQLNEEKLLTMTLTLQPSIHLFTWDYDLFTFRQEMLKEEPDYWIDHPFPTLIQDRPFSFVFFRDADLSLYWREISQAELCLLKLFSRGSSLLEACDFLETQAPSIHEEALIHLQKWLRNWAARGWLFIK